MRATIGVVLLFSFACQNNQEPPVAAAAVKAEPAPPPDPAKEELKRFLDGMLITSDAPSPTETIWPTAPDTSLFEVYKDWFKRDFRLESKEQARARIDVPPEQMDGSQRSLASSFHDEISLLAYWRARVEKDPSDAYAATQLATRELWIGDPKRAFDALAAVPADASAGFSNRAYFEHLKCLSGYQSRRYAQAAPACNLAGELDESLGYRTLVKVLLAMGKKSEGLAQARQLAARPGRGRDWKVQWTLGVAQQANGLDQEALATWSLARLRWPHNRRFEKAISSPRRSSLEWEKVEQGWEDDHQARYLASCGLLYSELGLNDRSELCYRRSEAMSQGPALAARLVHLGATDQPAALAKALEAVKSNPHPNLMTAIAWLLRREGKQAEAKAWVQKTLALDGDDVKAVSLTWEICGDEKDYLCVISYRKRLGVSTHFNVAQYQDLERVLQEKAKQNGLAAPSLDSASMPKPPKVDSIVIVPVGDRVPPELAGMAEYLSGRFPGVKITLGAREELQPGVIKTDTGQVIWERVLERLRDEPGRIYVLEDDLTTVDTRFVYSAFDLAHARGAVSLSRFRDVVGLPLEAGTTWSGKLLDVVRDRVRVQMTAAVGKLLGLSFPCTNEGCAMHERRSVKEFVPAPEPLCPKHTAELQAVAEQMRH